MSPSVPKPIKPNEEAQILLLSEVADMVTSKRSISSGLKLHENDSRGALGSAAKAVRERLEAGQPITEAFAGIAGRYHTAIRSTLQVVVETRSSELIYLLIDLIRQTSEERKQARLSAIAPFLNTLISATLLFLILPFVVESMASAELLSADRSPLTAKIASWLATHRIAAAVIGLIFALLLCAAFAMLAQKLNRKGRHYKRYAIFSRWLGAQLQTPVNSLEGTERTPGQLDLGTMISTAAEVAGISEPWRQCPEKIHLGCISIDELEIPDDCPHGISQCVVDLASGTRSRELVSNDLQGISEIYQRRSIQSRRWSLQVGPQITSWLLMILMVAIMLQAILLPLLEMLEGTFK